MSAPTSNNPKDLRTTGYVLRRTNYGEADRILSLITPHGKFTVMAKGVRKNRSKLAGGIEMFTLANYNLHFGRSDFGVLTSAIMLTHHSGIVKDLSRMEIAALVLKKISLAAESSDSPDYFHLTAQALTGLDNPQIDICLIQAWFWLHLTKLMGEEVNLYRDHTGTKLSADQRYDWHPAESCFTPTPAGPYGANEIKLLRLLLTADLSLVTRIKLTPTQITQALQFSARFSSL